jgi:hypothetical protein
MQSVLQMSWDSLLSIETMLNAGMVDLYLHSPTPTGVIN